MWFFAGPALACTCVPSPGTFELALPPESRGFPTDGRVLALFQGHWAPETLARVAQGTQLYREGVPVPVRRRLVGQTLELVPIAPLSPDTRYEVHRAFPYQAGALLPDNSFDDHDALLRYPVARFTTGQGPAQPATAPQMSRTRVEVSQSGDSCGAGVSVRVDVWLGEEIPQGSVVDLELLGLGVIGSELVRGPRATLWGGDLPCSSTHAPMPREEILQVRAVLRAPGSRAETPWAPLSVQEPPVDSPSRVPPPAQGALLAGPGPDIPLGPPPAPSPCAGLLASPHLSLPEGPSWLYDTDPQLVSWAGELVFPVKAPALLRPRGQGTVLPMPRVEELVAAADREQLALAWLATESSVIEVGRPRSSGQLAWRTPLEPDGNRPRLAMHRDRLLAVWRIGQGVAMAVLDAGTGAVSWTQKQPEIELHERSWSLGLAADDRSWKMVWTGTLRGEPGVYLTTLPLSGGSPSTETLASEVEAYIVDLVLLERQPWVVWDGDGLTVKLPGQAPRPLGPGSRPQLSVQGGRVLLGWKAGDELRAAVLSREGELSPAVQLGPVGARSLALAAERDRWLAVYADSHTGGTQELRCTDAPLGPLPVIP